MRKKFLYLFFFLILAQNSFAKLEVGKNYTFSGKLQNKGFPVKLILNEGTESEETLLLKNISADDAFGLNHMNVEVNGKLQKYQTDFHILHVNSIKSQN